MRLLNIQHIYCSPFIRAIQTIHPYSVKNNIKINAGNSGTFGRLVLGLLAKSSKLVHLTGDKSLSPNNELERKASLHENNIYGENIK